ncbi:MAG: ABC transporter ATP-binding protein [Rhodospirillaceae bacterium]|nr:ABC transporter ATP-binding protein [Rhodospirillaceae bacterium]
MSSQTATLDVTGLSKVFRNTGDGIAGGIREANFSLAPGTFFTLLGPSGCGKTTTLRCVAGLEQPDSGAVRLGQETFFDAARGINVPLNLRNIGMVFQSYAIWPHMTVFENVAFPLRVAKGESYEKAEVERLVGEALETVNLAGFQSRSATRLSGGQQQRVALARAIVRKPKLLLLDEPLSNLDAALREDMRNELKRLQKQVGVTTVYVTHDQAEALAMSDLVAVIDQGRMVQMGPPREIYFRPRNAFVAGFVGATNLVHGTVLDRVPANEVGAVRLDDGRVVRCLFPDPTPASRRIAVSVRPETIQLSPASAPERAGFNRMTGTVVFAGFLGNMNRYSLRIGGDVMHANAAPEVNLAEGSEVAIDFSFESAVGIPMADEIAQGRSAA